MAEIEYSFVSIYHIIIFLIQLTGLYYIIIVIITIIDKGASRHKDLQNNLNVWTDQSYSLTGWLGNCMIATLWLVWGHWLQKWGDIYKSTLVVLTERYLRRERERERVVIAGPWQYGPTTWTEQYSIQYLSTVADTFT